MDSLNNRVIRIEKYIQSSNYSGTLEGQLEAFNKGHFGIGSIMSMVVAFCNEGKRSLERYPEPLRSYFLEDLVKNKSPVRVVR
jgi:hypothetical protein